MDRDTIIEKWTAKLRSGEIQQANGVLNENGRMCCLGVLCEVAIEAGLPLVKSSPSNDGLVRYDGERYCAPHSVVEWAKLYNDTGAAYDENDDYVTLAEGRHELAALNDHGATFAEIALANPDLLFHK